MENAFLWTMAVAVPTVTVAGAVAARALQVTRPQPNGRRVRLLHHITFRTGDIILVHSNPFINGFAGGEWSHVGMVIIGNSGEPRLFDMDPLGPKATPLIPYLVENLSKGDHVVAYRRFDPPLPPHAAKLLRQFALNTIRFNIPYEHFYWRTIFRKIFGAFFPIEMRDDAVGTGSICSTLMVDALQACGVIAKTNSMSILPSDFGADSVIALHKPYRFNDVVFIRMLVEERK